MKLSRYEVNKSLSRVTLLLVITLLTAPVLTAKTDKAKKPQTAGNIVQTAVAAGQFKTLAAALEAAGLVEALTAQGPYTVFAPTDEAFAKLPAGTVESLLKPENKDKLKAILLYHVVPQKLTAAHVVKLNGRTVKTLEGSALKVHAGNGVQIDNAAVTKTDIQASNGVIHVIDSVLMPKM